MNERETRKERRRVAQNRSNQNLYITAALVIIVLLFAVINLFTKTKDHSDTENRSLAQWPSFSLSALADGSYTDGITDYVNDQFFNRDGWIGLKMRADSALGKKESGGVFICDDNYLMGAPETPDDAAVEEKNTAVNAFAEKYSDVNFYAMLVPTAATVMSDKLPRNAPVRNQLEDITKAESGLGASIQLVDASTPLLEHSDEYIYYKTDHHWTSLGASYAFESLSQAMNLNTASDYDVYTVTNDFEGTLSSESGSHRTTDSIDIYVPHTSVEYYVSYPDDTGKVCSMYQSEKLQEKDKYTVFFGGNYSMLTINTTATTDRTLLIFKDSYANCFVQFLTPAFETIIMVDPRYYYDNIGAIMNSYGVTDVLFLYCSDTYLTDTTLTSVLNSALTETDNSTNPFAAANTTDTAQAADTTAADSFGSEVESTVEENAVVTDSTAAEETAEETAETDDTATE